MLVMVIQVNSTFALWATVDKPTNQVLYYLVLKDQALEPVLGSMFYVNLEV